MLQLQEVIAETVDTALRKAKLLKEDMPRVPDTEEEPLFAEPEDTVFKESEDNVFTESEDPLAEQAAGLEELLELEVKN